MKSISKSFRLHHHQQRHTILNLNLKRDFLKKTEKKNKIFFNLNLKKKIHLKILKLNELENIL